MDVETVSLAVNNLPSSKPASALYFNSGDLAFTLQKLTIKNGTFLQKKASDLAPSLYFDGSNMRFDKINGSFSNVSFIKDTIKASIDISTKERCGLDVRKLKTIFKLTPQNY